MLPDGVARCARYALPPTDRRFCGPTRSHDVLRDYLVRRTGRDAAVAAFQGFEALWPHLEMMGRETGRDPFDPEVVRAYWVGGPLLDRDWRPAFGDLLKALGTRGLPRSFVARLTANLPGDPIPHHTFHVLFVGVGAVTGSVPTTLPNMDRCRIAWGRVREVEGTELRIRGPRLAWVQGAFRLGPEEDATVAWDRDLLPEVAEGDVVSLHWATAVERLRPPDLEALQAATARSLRVANEAAVHAEALAAEGG